MTRDWRPVLPGVLFMLCVVGILIYFDDKGSPHRSCIDVCMASCNLKCEKP